MSDAHVSKLRQPLVPQERTYKQISEDVLDTLEEKPSKGWLLGFSISALFLTIGFFYSCLPSWYWYWDLGTE